ncbi:hypothetical protein [Sporosarcina highlanderae]|uniref:Uncharacterized protein n=1 Tax=Sporosarcina highlanderae TaxID=3035916 RepID=A0ABT8JQB9_9BACL|nr:hypothetical protein [Sporosarcina highlanderae]MDN4607355.1 hypothetical protein [Sporosarcina highlanderae]
MKEFKVRINFLDGNVLTENFKSLSEEGIFEELQSRKEWYKISEGLSCTYINPSAIASIEIIDIEEFKEIAKSFL